MLRGEGHNYGLPTRQTVRAAMLLYITFLN